MTLAKEFHNEELQNLRPSADIIRMTTPTAVRWAARKNTVFVGKLERKKPVTIPRRRWKDDVKMDF
jgi:hypothetical protein